jgi:hypothetical protein
MSPLGKPLSFASSTFCFSCPVPPSSSAVSSCSPEKATMAL